MKKILFLLMLAIPFATHAQDLKKPAKKNGFEVGLNSGIAYTYNESSPLFEGEGRHTLSFYKNFKLSQIGASFEYIPNSWMGLYFSANAIVNKTIHFKKMYLYGGGLVGYKHMHSELLYPGDKPRTGYQFGLQVGIVQYLGRHFSFNAEIAARSEQIWYDMYESYETYFPYERHTYEYRDSYIELNYPITIGIRYRF